eukprot:TRINITY_DN9487_c0_g2_i4.p1 TRINITY_DN9487_c0_g2~~TRINITY_DN9487_c0_g2_i4.p1  ORF type:complete len:577 (+),score=187.25 TRINITY_DN9487_c0_g2_i4:519-2249(+)
MNLFTKESTVDINKTTSEVNYFRGENLLEKMNNREVLFRLATSELDDLESKLRWLLTIESDNVRKARENENPGNESAALEKSAIPEQDNESPEDEDRNCEESAKSIEDDGDNNCAENPDKTSDPHNESIENKSIREVAENIDEKAETENGNLRKVSDASESHTESQVTENKNRSKDLEEHQDHSLKRDSSLTTGSHKESEDSNKANEEEVRGKGEVVGKAMDEMMEDFKFDEDEEESVNASLLQIQCCNTPKNKEPNLAKGAKVMKKLSMINLIAERDKALSNKDKQINNLKLVNNKLIAKLRPLAIELDVIVARNRELRKPQRVQFNTQLTEKELELQKVQARVALLHKEVNKLRSKLDAKAGYAKLIDVENKIKEADTVYEKYSNEYNELEVLEVKQEKEIGRLIKSRRSLELICELSNELKKAKGKNRELVRKVQADTANTQRKHEAFVNLQEKLQKIREEKRAWRKALAEGSPPPIDNQRQKHEEEMVKNTITLIRKKMAFEATAHKRHVDLLRAEIAQLQQKSKEIEQENKLNAAKIKELKSMVRHNQLVPLEGGKRRHLLSPEPAPTKFF